MSDLHSGHRRRLKDKFINSPESLESHELLELLLFYSVPRCDTNNVAHLLTERFENLRGVLNADLDELCAVDGIGESSALLIKLCAAITSRYGLEGIDTRLSLPSFSVLCEYIKQLYVGTDNEMVYLILLNNSLKLIKTVLICNGAVNLSNLQIRNMIELGLKYKASFAILTHNHPDGMEIPSNADIEVTHRTNQAFSLINVHFLDHIIFADGKFFPIMHRVDNDDIYDTCYTQTTMDKK